MEHGRGSIKGKTGCKWYERGDGKMRRCPNWGGRWEVNTEGEGRERKINAKDILKRKKESCYFYLPKITYDIYMYI